MRDTTSIAPAAPAAGRTARRETRFPIALDAVLRGDAADQPVWLIELSRGGASASCRRPPAPGAAMILVRGDLTIEARVAWAAGGRIGLAFARPLRATQLLVQMSLSRAASESAPAR